MKQTLVYQGSPISVELLDPCCAPTPDTQLSGGTECQEFLEELEWLENFLLENPDLTWQTIGYRVSEVFQLDYNRWAIILSNGKKLLKCWVTTASQKKVASVYWASLDPAWA